MSWCELLFISESCEARPTSCGQLSGELHRYEVSPLDGGILGMCCVLWVLQLAMFYHVVIVNDYVYSNMYNTTHDFCITNQFNIFTSVHCRLYNSINVTCNVFNMGTYTNIRNTT